MKIQIITGNLELCSANSIHVSRYENPQSLDEFDLNILDLAWEKVWYDASGKGDSLNLREDLLSISQMIENSSKAKNVIVYPQNIKYHYKKYEGRYLYESSMKEIVNENSSRGGHIRMLRFFFVPEPSILFEPTNTMIGCEKINADFYFTCGDAITKSDKSQKITTVGWGERKYVTTLDICTSVSRIEQFVEFLFGRDNKTDFPQWVRDYSFGTDQEKKDVIARNVEQIELLNNEIQDAKKCLEDNLKYKSILCSNGDELVGVVFEILEELFDCSLKDFVDEKKEDFLIEKDKCVFIGEIKGVTSNVKNEHISQLELHYQGYIDEKNSEINESDVHALLIINPLRTTPLMEREPVHERQIELAKRNGSLIIETQTLLNLYEAFKAGKVSSETIIEKLSTTRGLLNMSIFESK